MSKVIIKRVGKEPEVVEYDGKFDDIYKLINLKQMQFVPFELGECDLSVGLNPLHKTDGSMPNFFIYDRYDVVCGSVVIFKSKYDENKNDYELIDLTNKDIKYIKDYMRREEYV